MSMTDPLAQQATSSNRAEFRSATRHRLHVSRNEAAFRGPSHSELISVSAARAATKDGRMALDLDRQHNREKPMSDEEMKAELDRLRSENAALKKGASSGVRMKVSEKGAVSVYGMGRFPVTLYKEQWLKLLDMAPEIRSFIAANEAQLKTKD
jgi:hypothetical protein